MGGWLDGRMAAHKETTLKYTFADDCAAHGREPLSIVFPPNTITPFPKSNIQPPASSLVASRLSTADPLFVSSRPRPPSESSSAAVSVLCPPQRVCAHEPSPQAVPLHYGRSPPCPADKRHIGCFEGITQAMSLLSWPITPHASANGQTGWLPGWPMRCQYHGSAWQLLLTIMTRLQQCIGPRRLSYPPTSATGLLGRSVFTHG